MRPTPTNSPLLTHLITDFLLRGGNIEEVPEGNCIRETIGESWKTVNENHYKIKLDKELAQ